MASLIDTISRPVAWAAIRRKLVSLRETAQNLKDLSAAGDTGRTSYRALQNSLQIGVNVLNLNASVPSLAAYVLQEVDSTYTGNLASDYVATRDSMIALQAWIHVNYPTGAGGADLSFVTADNGTATELTFTTAETAGFRTAVDTFLTSPFLADLV